MGDQAHVYVSAKLFAISTELDLSHFGKLVLVFIHLSILCDFGASVKCEK